MVLVNAQTKGVVQGQGTSTGVEEVREEHYQNSDNAKSLAVRVMKKIGWKGN